MGELYVSLSLHGAPGTSGAARGRPGAMKMLTRSTNVTLDRFEMGHDVAALNRERQAGRSETSTRTFAHALVSGY